MAKKKDEAEVVEVAGAEKAPKKAKAKAVKNPVKARYGKRGAAIREGLTIGAAYTLEDAVKELKTRAKAKFDETLNLAINLGIDPTDTNNVVRGVVAMPNGLGKSVRVGVFAKGAKAEEAKKAGADVVGENELIEQIQAGKIDFQVCIATPDMMGAVGKVAKILGPKGLMPNPKLGTVTMDVTAAVKAAKAGQVEFRADKGGIVHAGLGKASFSNEALIQNIKAFVNAVNKAKPQNAKGAYFKKATLSTTMGVGLKLDVADLTAEAA
jgi:large subunit ribosomal protein L1